MMDEPAMEGDHQKIVGTVQMYSNVTEMTDGE